MCLCFVSTTGYWKFCCNSQRHSTDAAGLWHWAGRDRAAWWGEGHWETSRISNWQVQETKGMVLNVVIRDAFIKRTAIMLRFCFPNERSSSVLWSTIMNNARFWYKLSSVWQDAIRSVSKEGRHLLSSLETSEKEDDSQWDVKLDWETVQR